MSSIDMGRAAVMAVVGPAVLGLALSAPKAAGVQRDDVARIESGTQITVRATENIDQRSYDNRVFAGVVEESVSDTNGRLAIPRGSPVELVVRDERDGDLVLDLDSVVVNGERYGVRAGN